MGDHRKCQTYAASPAEPGGLPLMLGCFIGTPLVPSSPSTPELRANHLKPLFDANADFCRISGTKPVAQLQAVSCPTVNVGHTGSSNSTALPAM